MLVTLNRVQGLSLSFTICVVAVRLEVDNVGLKVRNSPGNDPAGIASVRQSNRENADSTKPHMCIM